VAFLNRSARTIGTPRRARGVAVTIARLTDRPAVHLEKIDRETRVADADPSREDE